jgi:predicted AAA+ superfamily ATPase
METPETFGNAALARIADALERLSSPAPPGADLTAAPAYLWRHGRLTAIDHIAAQPLGAFVGIDAQKQALTVNSERLAASLPAHDVLLWGARGMGKSGLVKAVVAALQSKGAPLALVEVERDDIPEMASLLRRLGKIDRRFILFADDLSFEADELRYRQLRSLLEGGVEERPDNCRFYVTSNRRHLVPREMRENELAATLNSRDALDDRLALADRFGLSLGFHFCDQETYLAIVESYARRFDLPFDSREAVAWATGRGARSGRVAWQFIQEIAGRTGTPLPRA